MNQMRNIRQRLDRLERLPQFQPPPSPLEQIHNLALQQMSDEELELMLNLIRERDRGRPRTLFIAPAPLGLTRKWRCLTQK